MTWPPVTSLIPHRPPQLLLDRVVSVDGARVVAEGEVRPEHVPGHFPGKPVVPGVWFVEGMAQALACLGTLSGETGQAVLTGVEKARFRGFAVPPVTLRYHVEVIDQRFGLTRAKGRVTDGDRVLCTAEFQAALLPADAG